MKAMKNHLTRILILILLSSVVFSCRSRNKIVEKAEVNIETLAVVNADTLSVAQKEEVKKTADKISVEKKEKEISGNVKIEGVTDSLNAFKYGMKLGEDSLQISISGNASFTIENTFKEKAKEKIKEVISENLNIIQKAARTTVAKETFEKVAVEIKKADKKVIEKEFTFGAWFTGLLITIALIAAIWLFVYFGGKVNWKSLINKFRK